MSVFISEEEKLPSQCQPRPFYGQPRQLPCSRHFVTMPTHLPPISHFFLAQDLSSKQIVSQKHISAVVKQHTHLVCGRAHQNKGDVFCDLQIEHSGCASREERKAEKPKKQRNDSSNEGRGISCHSDSWDWLQGAISSLKWDNRVVALFKSMYHAVKYVYSSREHACNWTSLGLRR